MWSAAGAEVVLEASYSGIGKPFMVLLRAVMMSEALPRLISGCL